MKLFLALPVYGGYNPRFVMSLCQLVQRPPCEIVVRQLVGDSLVARARNNLAADFLATDCTHLLFLDSDLIWSPDHVARLISHEVDIIAGLYPKKQSELDWVFNPIPSEQADDAGLLKIKYAGTGCLLIKRSVFLMMRDKFPQMAYGPDNGQPQETRWDFFATGPCFDPDAGYTRYLSEDWFFCQRARECGCTIFMDTQVILKHVGEAIYPLQPLESFADNVAK